MSDSAAHRAEQDGEQTHGQGRASAISPPGGVISAPGGVISPPGGVISPPGGAISPPGGDISAPGRVVVLASGGGTNCQALIDAADDGRLNATIAAVITNNPRAGVIARAERAGIDVEVVEHAGSGRELRRRQDRELVDAISGYKPDLVVMAGWMRVLGPQVGAALAIINLHPALPGEIPGVGAIERAFTQWQAGTRAHSGVMVHWVPDDGVDDGPVIFSRTVEFEQCDTLESFAARMHAAEHAAIVAGTTQALAALAKRFPSS